MRKKAVLGVSDFLFVFNLIYGENSLFGKSEASFKPKEDQLWQFPRFWRAFIAESMHVHAISLEVMH